MRVHLYHVSARVLSTSRRRLVRRLPLLLLLCVLFAALCVDSRARAGTQEEPKPLDFGECGNTFRPLSAPPGPESRKTSRIRPGEMQCYRLELPPKHFVHVEVLQQGVDVLVQLFILSGASGVPVKGPIDNPFFREGVEPVSEVSDPTAATTFVIGVKSQDDETATDPQYTITVTDVREEGVADRDYIDAERALVRGRLDLNDAQKAEAKPDEDAARQLAQRAVISLDRARRLLAGGSGPLLEEVLNTLGVAYNLAGHSEEAISAYTDLRPLARNAHGPDGEAVVLINIAWAYSAAGRQAEAEASFKEASETLEGVSLPVRAQAWTQRSNWLLRNGNVLKSIEASQAAADLYAKANMPDEVTGTYTDMGILSFDKGALSLSRDYYNKALETGTVNPLSLGRAKYNLGVALGEMGEQQPALEALRDAQRLYADARSKANAQTKDEIDLANAHVLKTLGMTLASMGDDSSAEEFFRQSLELSEPVPKQPARFPDAAAYVHLYKGLSLYRKHETERAEEETQAAFGLFEKLQDDRGKANALANVGVGYAEAGDRARGLTLLENAAALEQGKDPFGLAYTKTNIAAIYIDEGRIGEAVDILNNALTLHRQVGDKTGEAITLYYLGRAESRRHNADDALGHVEAASRILEEVGGSIVDKDLRAGYRSSLHKIYELEIHLLALQGKAAAALEVADNARARALSEALVAGRVELFGGLSPEARARMQQVGDTLSVLIGRRKLLGPGAQDSQAAQPLDREINRLLAELHTLDAERQRSSPVSASLIKPTRLSADQIKAQLDPHTVLLEFSLGEEASYLWLVTGGSVGTVRVFPLPDRRKIEGVATPLRNLLGDKTAAHEEEIGRLSGKLSDMLLIPVANDLGVKRLAVVVVADGILQYIPFGALPTPGRTDGSPLIVGHEVVYLPSVSSLAALRLSRVGRPPASQTLAIFANPVYELPGAQVSTGKTPQKGADSPGQLAFSNKELSAIENAFKKSPFAKGMMKWTDYDANRLNAVGGETHSGLSDFSIIHYSTHGVADDSRPEASGLYLSRYDRSGRKIPDFVGLRDVYNMKLSADLVVLSACETALGKEVRGEGVIGLTHGFINSGASAVVASLWDVDEYHTSGLMDGFYERLLVEQLPPSEALRATQEEMWRAKLPRYLWAGFILEGEWVWHRPPGPSR